MFKRATCRISLRAASRAFGLAIAFSLLSLLPAAAQTPGATADSAAPLESSAGNFDLPALPFLPFLPLQPFASPFVNGPARTSRLFGFIPNYATVEGGARHTRILSSGEKFKLSLQGAFDPYEFVVVGVVAGVNQAENDESSFGHGFSGYGKRYAVDFANQAVGYVMTDAVFPSLLHQDPRYFQRGHGGALRRFLYAGSKVFVTRGDSGGTQFNYSEFAGNATAAALSNLYEPAFSRTLANGLRTWETLISIDAFGFEAKEFWPDLRRKLSHNR